MILKLIVIDLIIALIPFQGAKNACHIQHTCILFLYIYTVIISFELDISQYFQGLKRRD